MSNEVDVSFVNVLTMSHGQRAALGPIVLIFLSLKIAETERLYNTTNHLRLEVKTQKLMKFGRAELKFLEFFTK